MNDIINNIRYNIEGMPGCKITEITVTQSGLDYNSLTVNMKMVVNYPSKFIMVNHTIKRQSGQRIYRCF